MVDWLNIEGSDRQIRDSFLINKKPTQVEISRIKSIFRQIEEALITIENLRKGLGGYRSESDIKRRICNERERLLLLYESLNEIFTSHKYLWVQFTTETTKIQRQTIKVLEELFLCVGRF